MNDNYPRRPSGPEGLFMALVFTVAVFVVGVAVGFLIRVVIG